MTVDADGDVSDWFPELTDGVLALKEDADASSGALRLCLADLRGVRIGRACESA